ncbi:MAG TPA: HAMP domain-containing sensor histidine kinase [Chitinophagaceae bacterium]|jgi:signal transduction histidine kinase|nr:HAMP domain-containing sensor histidine kinase [Chitinophagaceae bacterium]
MTFNKIKWLIFFRVAFLLVALIFTAYLLANRYYPVLLLAVPVIIYLTIEAYSFQLKIYREIAQFTESVRYRDFSINFNERKVPAEIKELRKGFNEVNIVFRNISKEKETQHQYLQSILELIETGILSYDEDGGEILWMNEALKKMLRTPYLKKLHSVEPRFPTLYEAINTISPGQQLLIPLQIENTSGKILLSASTFITEGKKYKLVAFQNVNEVIEETEAKAWQKLLSVMTHEIMNSIAPISSLAETLGKRLEHFSDAPDKTEQLEDLQLGIETIKRRSEGLHKFAETYRSLSKINTLNLETIAVYDLFYNLQQLMLPTLKQKNIELLVTVKEPNMYLQADHSLMEQVLINLLVNAIDAVKTTEKAQIHLWAGYLPEKKINLKVIDNGCGMQDDVLENIFIPFFTTKKNGSGIGLSLCKQIIMLHQGTIQVQSVKGQGTSFSIVF